MQAGLRRAEAAQQRARRRRIQAFTALSVLLVLALAFAGLAVVQRNTAQQQQKVAVARGLVTQADAARNTDPRTALLLGIAAQRIHASPETQVSLVNTLTSTHYAGTLSGHTDVVTAVAYASDGYTVATGSADKTVILWDVADRARPRQLGPPLTGHTDAVTAVAFTPDGRTLATASGDTVRLWEVADRARPRQLGPPLTGHTNSVEAVAFAPDGRTLATGSYDHTVRLWDLVELSNLRNRPRRYACAVTGRGLNRDEWAQYVSGLPYRDTCAP